MQLGHGCVFIFRCDLQQLEVSTVSKANGAASLHPTQQPVWQWPIPADLQGAQPSKGAMGSGADGSISVLGKVTAWLESVWLGYT